MKGLLLLRDLCEGNKEPFIILFIMLVTNEMAESKKFRVFNEMYRDILFSRVREDYFQLVLFRGKIKSGVFLRRDELVVLRE